MLSAMHVYNIQDKNIYGKIKVGKVIRSDGIPIKIWKYLGDIGLT